MDASEQTKESKESANGSQLIFTNFLREKLSISQKYKNVIAMGLFVFASSLVMSLVIVYYNNRYLQINLGLAKAQADTIFSYSTMAGSIGYLITVIVGGAFSDDYRSKYGARAPFILGGCILAGIMLIVTPIIGSIIPVDLLLLILPVCFFFIYVGLGLGSSPTNALLSELFTKEQRGWTGLALAGFATIGSFVGIVIFQFVAVSGMISAMFTVAGLLTMLCGGLSFLLVEKANPPFPPIDDTIEDIIQTPNYLINFGGGDFTKMLIVQSLWGFATQAISIYLIVHLSTPAAISVIGAGNEGFILIITGVVAATMAIPAGFMISKFGKVKTGILGSFVYAIFCFLFAFIETGNYLNMFSIVIIAALGGLGSIFIDSIKISLPADLVPEGKEAQFMGINKFASIWTQPLVALIGAQLLILFAKDATMILFTLAGILSFIATGVLWLISYEAMIKSEYQKFYKRYLTAKGFLGSKIDDIVDNFL